MVGKAATRAVVLWRKCSVHVFGRHALFGEACPLPFLVSAGQAPLNMLLLFGWAFDLLLFVVGKSWSPIATQPATR